MSEEASVEQEEGQSKVSAYLQSPRKKRRNFVIMCLGENFDKTIAGNMEAYVRKAYPQLAISRPKNLKDLVRQFSRSISLLIVDDQFAPLPDLVTAVGTLKVKTKKDNTPVLFLTKTVDQLVAAYQSTLMEYQESDDYCDLVRLSPQQLLGRIKTGLDVKNRRRSRRFKVSIETSFFHLTQDKSFKAQLIDLSMHGAMIKSSEIDQFRLGDQIKISIPIGRYIASLEEGEFLRISAKVRRVYVAGDIAGVSFEYITDPQCDKLTKLLIGHAKEQFSK